MQAVDDDEGCDDYIGKGMFDLGQAYNHPNVPAIIDIQVDDSKGKKAGSVSISI